MRADGSSKFGPNNKYGYFPSVSAGYIVSEEDWFRNDVLTFLKLRGSYGVTGNDTGIGSYDALAGVGAVSYAGTVGTAITTIGNPDVKWEDFATKIHMERRTEHVLNHIDSYIEKKISTALV